MWEIIFFSFAILEAISSLYRKHPEAWNNDENRNSIISALVNSGVNNLLNPNLSEAAIRESISVESKMILMLEKYDPKKHQNESDLLAMMTDEDFYTKHRDMLQGCKRSVLKFYRRRIPCNCLDEKAREVNDTHAKTGVCDNCKLRKGTRALMMCAACNLAQYCSKECQENHWRTWHKIWCERVCKRKSEK